MDCREFAVLDVDLSWKSVLGRACRGEPPNTKSPTSARRLFSLDVLRYLLLTISRAQIRVFVKYGGTKKKKKRKKKKKKEKRKIT